MLDIKEVLFDENVCLNLNATTKDEVISEMTEMLYRNQVIEDQKTFIKEIYDRESEGITGIGDGIAIPHGRSKTVKKTVIAVGRADEGISDWETFDNIPVKCIIMFAIRDVDMSQHIMLLSHVAELLLDEDVIQVLHTAKTSKEIVNVLRKDH